MFYFHLKQTSLQPVVDCSFHGQLDVIMFGKSNTMCFIPLLDFLKYHQIWFYPIPFNLFHNLLDEPCLSL